MEMQEKPIHQKEYRAIVKAGPHEGHKGPFMEAKVRGVRGNVTFSLLPPVWQDGDVVPELGTYVVLSDLREKTGGWRAYGARIHRPTTGDSKRVSRNRIKE